ncbi:MAG: putative nucleotide-diphospho-sugar transferase [Verrucomicrobiota bacterium]
MNIVYSASGKKYLREALLSAGSLLKHNENARITIYTDQEFPNSRPAICFRPLPSGQRPTICKVAALNDFAGECGIYLDTDTKILASLQELWRSLSVHDFVIAHEPANIPGRPDVEPFVKYENSRHYNSGVFAFRKAPSVKRLFEKWQDVLSSASDQDIQIGAIRNDQEVLNELLFEDETVAQRDFRIGTVRNTKYNARGSMWREMKKDGLLQHAAILHCHSVWPTIDQRLKWKLLSGWRKLVCGSGVLCC